MEDPSRPTYRHLHRGRGMIPSCTHLWIPDLISSEALPTHHCMMYYGPAPCSLLNYSLAACLDSSVVHSGTISQALGPSCRHAWVWPQSQPLDCSCTSFFFTDFVVRPQPSRFDLLFPASTTHQPHHETIRTAPPAGFHRGTLESGQPLEGQPRPFLLSLYLSNSKRRLSRFRQSSSSQEARSSAVICQCNFC